jgi:L-malate glycosyltransferase
VTPLKPTILLATRNRGSTLEAVLARYCELDVPAAGWDIVIVDNGSTDHTKQVVQAFSERLPISYCFEPTPGKNVALNRGLPLVTGDLIVFTDDDIFPKSDWLTQFCAAADSHPSYAVFSGIIAPRWEAPPSEAIRRAVPLSICFGMHAPGMREGPSDANHAFGGNVAIRADAFRAGHRFDPTMGPRSDSSPMGSETELIRRLAHDGFKVWCCEQAVVEHLIPSAHMELSWILKRAERWGRASARLDACDRPDLGPMWMGIPRRAFRVFPRGLWNLLHGLVIGDGAKVLKGRWTLHELRGDVAEVRSMIKSRHPQSQSTLTHRPSHSTVQAPARRSPSEKMETTP